MRIERFKAADLSELDVQAAQLSTVPHFAELGAVSSHSRRWRLLALPSNWAKLPPCSYRCP